MVFRTLLFILLTTLFPSLTLAKVKVAFYEKIDSAGKYISLDNGGRFYHTAIQQGDGWMESIAYFETREFQDVRHDPQNQGHLYSVIEIDHPEIPEDRYKAELSKGFYTRAQWSSCKTTYCSKMVAQLLDIQPLPMTSYTGEGLGISPDDLYEILKNRPHREMISCRRILTF